VEVLGFHLLAADLVLFAQPPRFEDFVAGCWVWEVFFVAR
jgi:hypothetical protein